VAVASFQLAHFTPRLWFLYGAFLHASLQLTRLPGNRMTLRVAWLLGVAVYGPQLKFFWTIFGPAAVGLWLILATWLGIFLLLVRNCRLRFGSTAATLLTPFLWTGLEYFRSELYFLRFSWLSAGYLWSDLRQLPWLSHLGVYGVGFCVAAMAATVSSMPRRLAWITGLTGLFLLGSSSFFPPPAPKVIPSHGELSIAGVQLEFPSEIELAQELESLRKANPDTLLFVVSEYSFDGPVPERLRQWCRTNQVYLVAGGKDFLGEDVFYNTAFVIGPTGEVVFKQAKSVPIQFFKDGLPAPQRRLWESPWGRIGICICYDLSYTRVVDDLIRQGAQAIIVPTMDVAYWGEDQHRLHARVAPVRAAEYGVPIFRLASSGISQLVDDRGAVRASAPFPGDAATLAGVLRLPAKGTLPWDRWLAPWSVGITVITIMALLAVSLLPRFLRRR
jgi:apolipoprotein N-acyltransferase